MTYSATIRRGHAEEFPSAGLDAACELADSLGNGGRLEPLAIDGLPLFSGEEPYADLLLTASRYLKVDIAYERRTLLFGGPLLMSASAITSAVSNRRRRCDAERAAAAQWRPLGVLRVVATSQRLLVWDGGAWWSVWFGAITGLHPDATGHRVDLVFEDDPPYRFEGPDAAVLAVVIAWLGRAWQQQSSDIA